MLEGAHALPARPRDWAIVKDRLGGGCPLPVLPPPPAPTALLRTIDSIEERRFLQKKGTGPGGLRGSKGPLVVRFGHSSWVQEWWGPMGSGVQ